MTKKCWLSRITSSLTPARVGTKAFPARFGDEPIFGWQISLETLCAAAGLALRDSYLSEKRILDYLRLIRNRLYERRLTVANVNRASIVDLPPEIFGIIYDMAELNAIDAMLELCPLRPFDWCQLCNCSCRPCACECHLPKAPPVCELCYGGYDESGRKCKVCEGRGYSAVEAEITYSDEEDWDCNCRSSTDDHDEDEHAFLWWENGKVCFLMLIEPH
jgi:hypothetical protein